MDTDAFTWDEAKAAKNYAKHGVTFEAARDVFKDPFAIEYIDDRKDYGEERFIIIRISERPPVDGCLYDERRDYPHHIRARR